MPTLQLMRASHPTSCPKLTAQPVQEEPHAQEEPAQEEQEEEDTKEPGEINRDQTDSEAKHLRRRLHSMVVRLDQEDLRVVHLRMAL